MKDFAENPVCTMKVKVFTNSQGNIIQPGETMTGEKTVTFKGFASSITADEAINTENSPALHNGVSGLMWLFTGNDEGNFDENFEKHSIEVMEDD